MNFFQKFLKGHYSLAVTFWLFGVVASMVLGLVKLVVFLNLIMPEVAGNGDNFNITIMEVEDVIKGALQSPLLLTVVVFEFIYSVFASIGIWNASTVYKEEEGGDTIWAILAKIAVVLAWLNYVFSHGPALMAL